MSIIARFRPTVQTKAHRVSPVLAVPFGAGVFAAPAEKTTRPGDADHPRTWENVVRHKLRVFGLSPAEIKTAVEHIIKHGTVSGCPVVQRNDWRKINVYVEIANIDLKPLAPAPCPLAPARRFVPTLEDCREAAELFAEIEQADREQAMEWACMQAMWSDRLSGHPIIEDEMLAIGACG